MNSIKQFFSFDKFRAVYWVIAFATSQHTAWGAATTMQGSQGEGNLGWWLQGIAFAIAIDYTMVTVATKIRGGTSAARSLRVGRWSIPVNWYTITFAAVALASFYFQLLYAWKHADALVMNGGIAQEWVDRLQGLINARIVIAPSALPVIATLYTIGGLGKGGEGQGKSAPRTKSVDTTAPLRVAKPDLPQLPAVAKGLQPVKIKLDDGRTLYTCPVCQRQMTRQAWSNHKCRKAVDVSIDGQLTSVDVKSSQNGHTVEESNK